MKDFATTDRQVRYGILPEPSVGSNVEGEISVELALYTALLIICMVLITLVVIQARTAGMTNSDSSSIYRTRRGLEKTLHQATIVLAAVFLLLSLITSLPIFGSAG